MKVLVIADVVAHLGSALLDDLAQINGRLHDALALLAKNRVKMVLQHRSRVLVGIIVLLLVTQTATGTAAAAVALTAAAIVFAQAQIAQLDDTVICDEDVLAILEDGKERTVSRRSL